VLVVSDRATAFSGAGRLTLAESDALYSAPAEANERVCRPAVAASASAGRLSTSNVKLIVQEDPD
jgi:hypothetical protein